MRVLIRITIHRGPMVYVREMANLPVALVKIHVLTADFDSVPLFRKYLKDKVRICSSTSFVRTCATRSRLSHTSTITYGVELFLRFEGVLRTPAQSRNRMITTVYGFFWNEDNPMKVK